MDLEVQIATPYVTDLKLYAKEYGVIVKRIGSSSVGIPMVSISGKRENVVSFLTVELDLTEEQISDFVVNQT
jgi:hypothetical protein